jgi:UDP-N-acetylglucosamine 2-epimerase (non-hydrolysing)
MKQVLLVFGTRPEYLKLKPLLSAFQRHAIPFTLLQVLQHENLEISESNESFYAKVNIRPDPSLQRLTVLASEISRAVEPYILQASCLFIQGDTATAFFTALSAFHSKVPIYHVEAGLRTYDLANPFPEEAYRSMISRIATYHLCPDEAAKKYLEQEHIERNVFVVGNTILDLVKSYDMLSKQGTLVPITVHRRENWESLPDIVMVIQRLALQRPDLEFVWIYHPNPTLQATVQTIMQRLGIPANLRFEQPCSHKTLCRMIHDAYCLITDSGGIQEEASFVGKYSFVLRKTTERSSIPPDYLKIVDSPTDLLPAFLQKVISPLPSCTVYGTGHASDSIVSIYNLNNPTATV